MRRSDFYFFAVLILVIGCLNTNTGNPIDSDPVNDVHVPSMGPDIVDSSVSCPCNAEGRFVRVTVLAQNGENVTLRVDELIGTEPDIGLSPGDETEARFVGRLPCYRGTIEIESGKEALALFSLGEKVTPKRWAGIRLTPWADNLLFAQTDEADLFVPANELNRLYDNDRCYAEYGQWSDLPGTGTDGSSDVYWCVEDGEEYPCLERVD